MELLVRVIDKPKSGDPVLDAGRTEAGDVIAWHRDGQDWGREEISNPSWRIIRVPGMSEAEADALTAAELPVVFGGQGQLLRKRGMRLDVAALDALEGGVILATRQKPAHIRDAIDHVVSHENIRAVTSLRKPLGHPRVVGGFKAVIG